MYIYIPKIDKYRSTLTVKIKDLWEQALSSLGDTRGYSYNLFSFRYLERNLLSVQGIPLDIDTPVVRDSYFDMVATFGCLRLSVLQDVTALPQA